jgi:hypothetical protein
MRKGWVKSTHWKYGVDSIATIEVTSIPGDPDPITDALAVVVGDKIYAIYVDAVPYANNQVCTVERIDSDGDAYCEFPTYTDSEGNVRPATKWYVSDWIAAGDTVIATDILVGFGKQCHCLLYASSFLFTICHHHEVAFITHNAAHIDAAHSRRIGETSRHRKRAPTTR